MTDAVKNAWNQHGFFVIKDLFPKETMTSLEECINDPNVQVCYTKTILWERSISL